MTRQIGIYSGTFDPIHQGHLAFAEAAMRVCSLDEVLFIPEQRPRGKSHVTDISHRFALIERATATTADFRAMKLVSEQFTVERTLPELRRIFGGNHLTLLVGSDVVQTFLYRWEGLEALLREVSLAVGLRSNASLDDVATIMRQLSRQYDMPVDYTLVTAPEADMASSRIRNGATAISRLHPGTLDYIQEHQLYLN